MTAKPTAQQAAELEFRQAIPPELKRYAQCSNCKHFVYDDSERMGLKGQLLFKKTNQRCRQHDIKVQIGTVCNTHQFAYADRGDR